MDTTRWTLAELSARIAGALSQAELSQESGRVRDIPNARTIRYYTTIGLVDRPLAMDGRAALYGQRHLLQLVAIKRLQAQGATLEEVQQRLVGLPDAALAVIAALPIPAPDAPPALTPKPASPQRETPFWVREPAPVTESAESITQKSSEVNALKHKKATQTYPCAARGVWLRPDMSLVLSADGRPLSAQDIEAIEAAAQPLLQVLETRRLIRRSQED